MEETKMHFQSGRDANRVPLWEVAPREIPFSLGITPSDVCNFRCNYCNQSTPPRIKDAKVITWDDFLFLAAQIEELVHSSKERLKIIRLIGNGEPLLNKRLPDMVKYLVDHDFADRVEVTTNGSLLTHEMADGLIEAGLTRLLISVQGTTKEMYKNICGYNIDYDRFLEQIRYFHEKAAGRCKVFAKIVDTALTDEADRERFYQMFAPVCDSVDVENILRACADVDYDAVGSKDIDTVTRYGTEVVKKLCCDTLFMYMNVHANGDVDCCGCKYPPLYIGNIYKNTLRELWNGKVHREIMRKHLEGRREDIPMCAECASIEHFNGFPEDNLDDHRQEVLARLERL